MKINWLRILIICSIYNRKYNQNKLDNDIGFNLVVRLVLKALTIPRMNRCGVRSYATGQGSVTGTCKHSNEHSYLHTRRGIA